MANLLFESLSRRETWATWIGVMTGIIVCGIMLIFTGYIAYAELAYLHVLMGCSIAFGIVAFGILGMVVAVSGSIGLLAADAGAVAIAGLLRS